MTDELLIKMYAFTVDCNDPHQLARFYAALLKWDIKIINENFVYVYAPGTHRGAYPALLFQRNNQYQPPVWPSQPEAQQQMAHIDFAVNDLEKAVQYAIECGATMAESQFSDEWKVMLDPAGHPFCLCEMKSVIENPHFALL